MTDCGRDNYSIKMNGKRRASAHVSVTLLENARTYVSCDP